MEKVTVTNTFIKYRDMGKSLRNAKEMSIHLILNVWLKDVIIVLIALDYAINTICKLGDTVRHQGVLGLITTRLFFIRIMLKLFCTISSKIKKPLPSSILKMLRKYLNTDGH